ncbi:MAG: tRNA uridine-5-carboxymethylaminomethyl(34) synthesis enzyme MnmG [bacterium]
MDYKYDIIVVGGGHAGCEAAAAAARMGSKVLLITMNLSSIAQMSCNPAMGGIAKGQIVREIDALGGLTGIVTDHTMIQFRMLNKSKGPAMWSPRAQSDKLMFSLKWRQELEKIDNISFWQDSVTGLLLGQDHVKGVVTKHGLNFFSHSVIITSGTFLNGSIHIGKDSFQGGRLGEQASKGLSESIHKMNIDTDRMKTGTPVRVDGRSIDFSKLIEQPGDQFPKKISFTNTPALVDQMSCFLAYTDDEVHGILKTGFKDSPLFTGRIQGTGPRYCPSIEDKIERFSDKNKHQLFIEPEGRNTIEYYVNGFSSSLPFDVQDQALHKIKGFENSRILKPGYAIEYDYFPPTQLLYTLESKQIENLYFAGQVNGTTGYEEAACQGLVAGINANLKINKKDPFILKRSESYIGVLIDDLVTKGTDEPYRMFTSRAEFRILLRQDNADYRLTRYGYQLGLIPKERYDEFKNKYASVDKLKIFIKESKVHPDEINSLLTEKETSVINTKYSLHNLLLRPQVSIFDFYHHLNFFKNKVDSICHPLLFEEILESAEILIKYQGYVDREKEMAGKIAKMEDIPLKNDFDYSKLTSISHEGREKLMRIKPRTIGQAARISGIKPSDISVILIHLRV